MTRNQLEKNTKEIWGQIEGIKQVTKSFGWKFFSHQTDHKPEQILNELFSFLEFKIGKKWFLGNLTFLEPLALWAFDFSYNLVVLAVSPPPQKQ